MKTLFLTFLLAGIMVCGSMAQQHQSHQSQYKGQEARAIKSLSESDIEELKEGKGWGVAKAAELNGYPGPAHVLELKDDLELTSDQIQKTENLFQRMQAEAIKLGHKFIEAEWALTNAFSDKTISAEQLDSLVTASTEQRGALRVVHLSAHLEMMDILSEGQIRKYNDLRGYTSTDPCENIPEGHNPEMWKKHNNCSE